MDVEIRRHYQEQQELPQIATCVLIVRPEENGYSVLVSERRTQPDEGRLQLPGGKKKGSEGVREAAIRECLEETNIDMSKQDLYPLLCGSQVFSESGYNFYLFAFVIIWKSEMGEPLSGLEPEKHGN